MKTNKTTIIGAVAILLASAVQTRAIEGIQVSVQSSNAVLSWPSVEGETYIVQYRQTLSSTDSWTTLADYFPAASGTNSTSFVHSNIVLYPFTGSGSGTNGSNFLPPLPDGMSGVQSALISTMIKRPDVPMVIPANASGGAVPLALFPPGFDLSGFTIFDPVSGESVSGNGHSVASSFINSTQDGEIQPLDASGGGTDSALDTAFYRVVRDGPHIWGLTNGMVLHDEVITPIEFAVDSTDQIVGVTFYDQDNNPIVGATAQPKGDNGWLLVWDTTMSFNGDYNIYAELNFASDSSIISAPVALTVSNAISFPNYFSRAYGSQMWIYAQTVFSNASYQVYMYDENTNYLGYFQGTTDGGGTISFLWGLQGFSDTNFYSVFSVTASSQSSLRSEAATAGFSNSSPEYQTLNTGELPEAGGSSASASQMWVEEPVWTPNNNWVVAYGLFNGDSVQDTADTRMIAGGTGDDTEYFGVLGALDEYGLRNNLSPGNNAQAGIVFTVKDQSSRSNLLSYLPGNYRNFYFFGHGNDSAIGSYNGFILTLDQIAFALGNVPLDYPNPVYTGDPSRPPTVVPPTLPTQIKTVASHPYRFVFIDACDTGAGHLCEAFAIPSITVSTNFFKNLGVESRAYVGFRSWNLNFNIYTWEAYSLMTAGFLEDWLSNKDVQTCIADAENGYGSGAYMDSSVWIYGAYDLRRDTRTRP